MIAPQARKEWLDFDARVRRYVARRLGGTAEVDDAVQEILAHVHEGLASLHDATRFAGWSYRIASHVVVDRLRARARDPLKFPLASAEAIYVPPTMAALVDEDSELRADLVQCVIQFVGRLPSPYREAVTLTELGRLTQKDAAEQLGISLTAMKSRVLRGRGRIRAMFDECCRISTDCRGRVVECESRPLDEVPEDCRAAAAAWIARRGR